MDSAVNAAGAQLVLYDELRERGSMTAIQAIGSARVSWRSAGPSMCVQGTPLKPGWYVRITSVRVIIQ